MRSFPVDLVELLALRLAARQQQRMLATHLLTHGIDAVSWADTVTPRQRHVAQRQARAIAALGIAVVPIWELPARLREAHPPALLFVRGDPSLLRRPAVAVVGSRRAGAQAVRWTESLASKHGRAGTLVVSGGAAGIDAAAHRGALSGGGQTLAYLGCAIDQTYPVHNRPLFQQIIAAGGALVSEHPPLASTPAYTHAARNRFIAAHASCLIVVEAAESSGTLGTARFARRLGRDIVVSPHHIGRLRAGIDELVRKGWARPWESGPEVAAEACKEGGF